MTNSPNLEALLQRIRALRSKAEDKSVSEEEAALYSAKVAELLQKHNLDESTLNIEDQEPISSEEWRLDYGGDSWRRALCHQCALLYFCEGYVDHYVTFGKARDSFRFIGRAHNIVVAREMAEYLINTTLRLGRQYRADHNAPHRDFTNFLRACGMRIAVRLQEKRKEAQDQAPQRAANGNPGNLPALYEDENALCKAFLKANARNLKGTRAGSMRGHGAHAGWAAGGEVGLNTQLSNSKSNARLLS